MPESVNFAAVGAVPLLLGNAGACQLSNSLTALVETGVTADANKYKGNDQQGQQKNHDALGLPNGFKHVQTSYD